MKSDASQDVMFLGGPVVPNLRFSTTGPDNGTHRTVSNTSPYHRLRGNVDSRDYSVDMPSWIHRYPPKGRVIDVFETFMQVQ